MLSDLGSQNDISFSWSPVTAAANCPAIYYNILASNCGSCPTTTNHTNVTCTGVPTDSVVCKFAVQPIICNSIMTKNLTEVIQVQVVLRIKYNTRNSTSQGAIITMILVALVLAVLAAASTVAAIYYARERKKIQRELEEHDGDYEDVRSQQQKATATTFDTATNIAYRSRITLQKQLDSDHPTHVSE